MTSAVLPSQASAPTRRSLRKLLVTFSLLAAILIAAIIVLGTGKLSVPWNRVAAALTLVDRDPALTQVIWGVRLPRVVTALGVGAALGAAGAVFQSLSRNALGSPDIIGFSSGAAAGAVAQIVLFNAGRLATALAAVVAGLLTAVVVYFLARLDGQSRGGRLVLVGIGVGAFLSALTTLLLAKGDLNLAQNARLWLSGSLTGRTWMDAAPIAVAALILIPLLALARPSLDVLEMGDDQALQLGLSAERVRLVTMGLAVVLTALATAAAGPIAFVALAAPQLASRLTGSPGVPIGTGALTGAALLVGADLLTLHLPVNVGLPVGLTTAILGGIYLLALLRKDERS